MNRKLKIVLIIIAFVLIIIGAGMVWLWIQARESNKLDFPPEQSRNSIEERVEINGFRLHIYCSGNNIKSGPTVILDAGLNQPAYSWILVQRGVEKFARVCSYDRAGHGLSDLGPNPRTSIEIAKELQSLLHKAAVKGPYILVGHSMGGINMRIFETLYPNEVYGMVLVDASHEDQDKLFSALPQPKPPLKMRMTMFFIKHVPLIGWELISGGNIPPKSKLFSDEEWKYYLSVLNSYNSFVSTGKEKESFTANSLALKKMNQSLGNMPLVVITHGMRPPTDDPALLAAQNDAEKIWAQLQDQLAQLSTNSRHIIAYNSGHMIPLEEPDIITGAIKNMIFNQNKCAVKEECSENHAARLGSS